MPVPPPPLWVLVDGVWKMAYCPKQLEKVWKFIPAEKKVNP
jgi:hypothetical protein